MTLFVCLHLHFDIQYLNKGFFCHKLLIKVFIIGWLFVVHVMQTHTVVFAFQVE